MVESSAVSAAKRRGLWVVGPPATAGRGRVGLVARSPLLQRCGARDELGEDVA